MLVLLLGSDLLASLTQPYLFFIYFLPWDLTYVYLHCFRFTPKHFVTLFMTSYLEATKAAVPMDSVPSQDGTQSQASVPPLFQNSLPDGCCCHNECTICHYLFSLRVYWKNDFIIVIMLTSIYVFNSLLLINIEITDIPVHVSSLGIVVGTGLGKIYCRSSIIL